MKAELEPQDVEAIAQRVKELLSPALAKTRNKDADDIIFDVGMLAEYLKVNSSWIYKQVQYGTIPHIKLGKYLRFSKAAIDKHLERSTVQANSLLELAR